MREKDREEKEKGGYKGKKKIEDTKEEERGEGKNAQWRQRDTGVKGPPSIIL